MITIPASLISREDLSILERALIPLIAHYTQQWGDKPRDIDASTLAQTLRHNPKEVVEALDLLVKKGLLKMIRRKTAQGVMIYYTFAPIETSMTAMLSLGESQYSDSNYYLNLTNDAFEALHVFAFELCDREGLRRDLFDDFNLYQRSKNNRSFDWCAEFERWARKEISTNSIPIASQLALNESKPSTEEFEMAQYFIRHLSSIDPQFEEPFDVMSWAAQIKLLIDTGGYTILDVKSVIDWLFSAKGDWFRPNVPDAIHLRKHFKRLIAHTRSFRDGKPRLPDGIDLFDLYEQM
ncbi:MAG: hypothetical protein PHO27_05645 [Sulfuricurvum sp.]|nr:hypothetical protein [Sulfuricurvum sp.]